jgi:hypothetical protein
MELVRITVRVPPRVRDELKALKMGLPRPLRKTSQDDIVGALILAARSAKLSRPLANYYDAVEAWDEGNDA